MSAEQIQSTLKAVEAAQACARLTEQFDLEDELRTVAYGLSADLMKALRYDVAGRQFARIVQDQYRLERIHSNWPGIAPS